MNIYIYIKTYMTKNDNTIFINRLEQLYYNNTNKGYMSYKNIEKKVMLFKVFQLAELNSRPFGLTFRS